MNLLSPQCMQKREKAKKPQYMIYTFPIGNNLYSSLPVSYICCSPLS